MVRIFDVPYATETLAGFLSPDDRLTLSCTHRNIPSVYIPVAGFQFSSDYSVDVPEDKRHNEVRSQVSNRIFRPKYIEVESLRDLKNVVSATDNGIRVTGQWISENMQLLSKVKHTLDLSGCGIENVEPLSHIQHTLNLNDNKISDVSPLAKVRKHLHLKNNYIVDVSNLASVKKDLDLRDNYILDIKRIRNIPNLRVEGNYIPGASKQKLVFVDEEHALQVISEIQQSVQDPHLVTALSQWLGILPQLSTRQKKNK